MTALAALLVGTGRAFADPPVTMAPPVDSAYPQGGDGRGDVASQDSVFNWKEVPADQDVPLQRAVFDRGGYQLYDTAGETIVVPFSDSNLYVMKFGLSKDGTTYFVNEGDAPVLYVPRGGYLENAGVPGARWFPFPENFRPERPVFLGIAPSWGDYCAMGWYPNMAFYGGYWGERPYFAGSVFAASFGLSIFIGGHHYDGWEPYRHYYAYHPAPYHLTVIDRNVYHFGGGHGDFRGAGRSYGAGRGFGGDGHSATRGHFGDAHDFEGLHPGTGHGPSVGRVFNGTGRPYYAHRAAPGGREFDGIRGTAPNGGRTFESVRPSSGARPFGGGHTFEGGRSNAAPVFDHARTESGRAFSGGGRPDGPHSASPRERFSGGARPSSGGGGTHAPPPTAAGGMAATVAVIGIATRIAEASRMETPQGRRIARRPWGVLRRMA